MQGNRRFVRFRAAADHLFGRPITRRFHRNGEQRGFGVARHDDRARHFGLLLLGLGVPLLGAPNRHPTGYGNLGHFLRCGEGELEVLGLGGHGKDAAEKQGNDEKMSAQPFTVITEQKVPLTSHSIVFPSNLTVHWLAPSGRGLAFGWSSALRWVRHLERQLSERAQIPTNTRSAPAVGWMEQV